ncbi:MAG: hypothetical protein A3F41_03285 [Coxiella sp. RIFCSPHIGHO2_12_FULL_44_14]|nr:MAG: hypothetical protein A3F41_03285 [Coxiella sp. RIFCSPHIGHO2_12_FULL_44_14]
MFKKTTIAAVLGSSALLLGILGAANADSTTVDAVGATDNAGFYVDANMGYGKVNEKATQIKTDNKGLMYNFDGGYQFNKNLGLEAGYTHFNDVKVGSTRFGKNNYSVDIALKGILPVGDHFHFFGKAGIARVSTEALTTQSLMGLRDTTGISTINLPSNKSAGGVHNKILPYLGAGVGYSFNQHISLDVQFAGTPKSGPVPSMYGVTAGVSYLF